MTEDDEDDDNSELMTAMGLGSGCLIAFVVLVLGSLAAVVFVLVIGLKWAMK